LKLVVKIVDWNFISDLLPHVTFMMGDYATFKKKLSEKKQ